MLQADLHSHILTWLHQSCISYKIKQEQLFTSWLAAKQTVTVGAKAVIGTTEAINCTAGSVNSLIVLVGGVWEGLSLT